MTSVHFAFQILRLFERLSFDMPKAGSAKSDKFIDLYLTGMRLIHQPLFDWVQRPEGPVPDLSRHFLAFQGASDNLCYALIKYDVVDYETVATFSAVTERATKYYAVMCSELKVQS